MKWTKIEWNKTNTIILAIMILIVMGIGKQANLKVKEKSIPEEYVTEESIQEMQNQNEEQNVSQVQLEQTQSECLSHAITHVTVGAYGGSGVVVDIKDEKGEKKVIIATCKHLLQEMGGPKALIDDYVYEAEVIEMSEQYDLGFIQVAIDKEKENQMIKIEKVSFPKTQQEWENATYLGTDVYQYSAVNQKEKEQNAGYITDYEFIPEFNNDMIVTKCHVQAGMSGGGVFDETGLFLGMISGGADPNESEITYSLASYIIQTELNRLIEEYVY